MLIYFFNKILLIGGCNLNIEIEVADDGTLVRRSIRFAE